MRILDCTLLSISRENQKSPHFVYYEQVTWRLSSQINLNWRDIVTLANFAPAFLPAALCEDEEKG